MTIKKESISNEHLFSKFIVHCTMYNISKLNCQNVFFNFDSSSVYQMRYANKDMNQQHQYETFIRHYENQKRKIIN